MDSNLNEPAKVDKVHFGTDGWRAIIDADFNPRSVARTASACARVFAAKREQMCDGEFTESGANTLLIGYDCRQDAGRYAVLAATVLADAGFDVEISDRFCPTPALCWTIAQNPHILGGLMLTSSHNPAEWLGIKIRMQDGGASPKAFSDEVENALADELPNCMNKVLRNFDAATNGTPQSPAQMLANAPELKFVNIMDNYLAALERMVDLDAIAAANLHVVLDPMYGAGRGYLASVFAKAKTVVVEVNGDNDPSFDGLHPEPVAPWTDRGAAKVASLGFDACFITDGDADRIGAIDDSGTYVSSHKILALLTGHLLQNRQQSGRVVRTLAGSALLKRQCKRLGLPLTTKPIGFKWIYEEMLLGDVLIGGEESGGMGIPSHVRERDGLLMALLLSELMAKSGKNLRQLVDELLQELGVLEYARRDLKLAKTQKQLFLDTHVHSNDLQVADYLPVFSSCKEELISVLHGDGVKFSFASDAWLLVRASGTEPLVRVYAEAANTTQVTTLLDIGCKIAQG